MAKVFALSLLFLLAVTVNTNPVDENVFQDLKDLLEVVKDKVEEVKDALEETNSDQFEDEHVHAEVSQSSGTSNGKVDWELENEGLEDLRISTEDCDVEATDMDENGVSKKLIEAGCQTVVQSGADKSQHRVTVSHAGSSVGQSYSPDE